MNHCQIEVIFLIVLYIILLISALLLLLVLFAKISLAIKLSKPNGENFKHEISLYVLGQPVDLSSFIKAEKNHDVKSASEKAEKRKKPALSERLHNLRIDIERGRYTYLLSKRYVRKKIKIDKFDFDITFGLDDAAHTGIATGAAWGSVYNIFGFIDRLFTVKSHKFRITPVFDAECFEMHFETRLKFSLSNIIAAAFAIFINYTKSKIKIRKG